MGRRHGRHRETRRRTQTRRRQSAAETARIHRRTLEALKSKAGTVRERLAAILQHESSLRRIAHEIRLSGVNAVIICAKLGKMAARCENSRIGSVNLRTKATRSSRACKRASVNAATRCIN